MKTGRHPIHWFDKEILAQLEKYDLLSYPPGHYFSRINELVMASTGTSVALFVMANHKNYWLESHEDIDDAVQDKLFELSLILKDGNPKSWNDLRTLPFFHDLETWESLHDYRFFYATPIQPLNGPALGWLCMFDFMPRVADHKMVSLMSLLSDMLMDDLEQRMQVNKSDRIQKDLIYLAAHDLKNPLGGIMGITDHLKKQLNHSEQAEEFCTLIKDSSKRMLSIIDEMLASAYLETGKLQLKYTKLPFGDLVAQVLNGFEHQARLKLQQFSMLEKANPEVEIDYIRMQEILENLISNAVKYAPKESIIEVKVEEMEDMVRFSIKNEGVGLSLEDRQKVFSRFSKLSAKPTAGETSTGLGLSIVKQLTEMHSGHIYVESEGIDKGATFILEIPKYAPEKLVVTIGEW